MADGYRFRVLEQDAQTRARNRTGAAGRRRPCHLRLRGAKTPGGVHPPLASRRVMRARHLVLERLRAPRWLALPLLRSRTPPYVRQVFDRRPRCQGRVTITVPRVSYRGSFPFGQSARGRFYGPDLLVIFLLVRTERTLVLVTDTNRNIRVRVLKKKGGHTTTSRRPTYPRRGHDQTTSPTRKENQEPVPPFRFTRTLPGVRDMRANPRLAPTPKLLRVRGAAF